MIRAGRFVEPCEVSFGSGLADEEGNTGMFSYFVPLSSVLGRFGPSLEGETDNVDEQKSHGDLLAGFCAH